MTLKFTFFSCPSSYDLNLIFKKHLSKYGPWKNQFGYLNGLYNLKVWVLNFKKNERLFSFDSFILSVMIFQHVMVKVVGMFSSFIRNKKFIIIIFWTMRLDVPYIAKSTFDSILISFVQIFQIWEDWNISFSF
jgi:hypothetical protein